MMEGARGPKEPASQKREWRARFEAQATPHKLEPAFVYAATRAEMINALGGRTDDAEELVHAALADTLAGDIAWDPERMTLAQHLIRTIRGRTKNEVLRAAHLRHESIDETVEIDGEDVCAIEQEAALAQHDDARVRSCDLRALAPRVMRAIRALSSGDRHVTTLLDAYEEQLVERAEIMDATGISAEDYDNARRRLVRLVELLPVNLYRDARSAIA
jgi:hypothetical protein